MKDRLLIVGNTILAILIIFASLHLVAVMNSNIIAVLLALVVAAWIWFVFGNKTDNNSSE